MALDGVLVMLGMMSGSTIPPSSQVELGDVLRKRIAIKGSTLRARDVLYKVGVWGWDVLYCLFGNCDGL
jgi:hypothetical protein